MSPLCLRDKRPRRETDGVVLQELNGLRMLPTQILPLWWGCGLKWNLCLDMLQQNQRTPGKSCWRSFCRGSRASGRGNQSC